MTSLAANPGRLINLGNGPPPPGVKELYPEADQKE
jgi:hypothetical protein